MDTGAPTTFFDRGTADALGIRIRNTGSQTTLIRILGGTWVAQYEYVTICLAHEPNVSWDAQVPFIQDPNLQMPFQGVLGSVGFLQKFAVTFNEYYGYFVIERSDDFHEATGKHISDDAPPFIAN